VFVVGEKNFRSRQALRKIGAKFLRKTELPAAAASVTTHLVFVVTREVKALKFPGAITDWGIAC
jgi:hypothetical protein